MLTNMVIRKTKQQLVRKATHEARSFNKDKEMIVVQSLTENGEWENIQNHLKSIGRRPRRRMSKTDAAIIIQRTFRKYIRRKLMIVLNRNMLKRFQQTSIPTRKLKRDKVLEMFAPFKNKLARSNITNWACHPTKKRLLTKTSLFKRDRETVLVFGGIDPHNDYGVGKNTGKNILRYVPDENTWEFVGELPEPRHHHCVEFFNTRIYLVGGGDPLEEDLKDKSVIVNTTWSFDPATKCWFSEPHLQEGRKNFGLVALNQSLYAIGGQGKDYQALRSLEKFSAEKNIWEKRAPMIHSRIGLACAKYRNYIWVAGGLSGSNNQRKVLDSVESYNLKSNQWTELDQPLRIPKCFTCMFVMSDRLYIIGGAGKTSDREKNTTSVGDIDVWDGTKLMWKTVTEMHIPRHGHSVAYLGTQILITGGVTTTYRRALSNTECFCSQRGTWVRGLACLPTGLSGHAAITLPPASVLE